MTSSTPDTQLGTTPHDRADTPASVILSAEQLVTATEWVESGHVRSRSSPNRGPRRRRP